MVVRPAVDEDVVLLGAIEVAAGARFRDVGLDSIADDEPFPDEDLHEAIGDGRLWVAVLDGEVVAYALGVLLAGAVGEGAAVSVRPHLEQVSVLPSAGGQGVGAALVAEVSAWGRRLGAGELTLTTFRDLRWNAPWYERLGFEVIADAELDDALREVRAHERELGIDVAPRVAMRLAL